MPILDIDPTLRESDAYLRRYGRTADAIYGRTVPPDARGGPDYGRGVTVPPSETFLRSSFDADDMVLGHANYLEYLCEVYATHGVFVITPDILWHTILCEIAAAVRADSDRYASLFTRTPGEVQEIVLMTGAVDELPLAALTEELWKRVPVNPEHYFPRFTTTDDMALFARFAAFADICSPYYRYSTMLCGYRAVDVRGTRDDYVKVGDYAAHLALDLAIGGDTEVSFWLNGRVIPLINRFVQALDDGDGKFFGEILYSKRCGSGGEIEVYGWWTSEMYIKSVEGKKPANVPSHLARVTWKNLETGLRFSINFGLFYSTKEGDAFVPQWGWVQNSIVEPGEPVPMERDANGMPKFAIQTVQVTAKTRRLDPKYLSGDPVLAGFKGREGPAQTIINAPFVPQGLKGETEK
jgi:hypothetical protein